MKWSDELCCLSEWRAWPFWWKQELRRRAKLKGRFHSRRHRRPNRPPPPRRLIRLRSMPAMRV